MKMNKIKIALVCISAIFFFTWAGYGLSFVLPSYKGAYLSYAFAVPQLLLSVVSLFGSLLFVLEMKSKSNRWYLGIPLCIVILIIVITNFLSFSHGKPFLSDPISITETIWITSLTMLAPCSILFFLSFSENLREINNIPIVLSAVISIFDILFFYFALRDIISPHPTLHAAGALLVFFYWSIGMPIIGVCLVTIAIIYKE